MKVLTKKLCNQIFKMESQSFIWMIFLFSFIVRVIFIFIFGIEDNYSKQPDSRMLLLLADQIIDGNYNLDIGRFIVSPLYPYFLASIKVVFGENWNFVTSVIQLSFASFSVVLIYKISKLLFSESVSKLSAIIYSVFPMTLWYTNTFSQESLFQCFLITFLFFFIKSISVQRSKYQNCFLAALFFSLAFLSKSHILLYSIFIPFIYLVTIKPRKKMVLLTALFTVISIAATVPFGLYNYKINDLYVLSSNGAKYQFYLGNTEAGYITVVSPPKKGTSDYKKMKDINVYAGYFNGNQQLYDDILKMPQKDKQDIFFFEAITWIKENPTKFVKLKIKNFLLLFRPGVSSKHYEFNSWLFSFLISLPLYLFSLFGVFFSMKSDWKRHIWFLNLILSMVLFSVIWYVQNRFRTITIEPFMSIYAAYFISLLWRKNKSTHKSKTRWFLN